MKKKLFYLLIVVFLATFCIFLMTDYSTRVTISSWLAIPNQDFITNHKIKCLKIEINQEQKTHFNQLYDHYSYDGNTIDFSTYYSANNKWKSTTLVLNRDTFHVQIKSHGRAPTGHKFGTHISLTIRFTGDPHPFFGNRINLIIYNRIQLSNDMLQILAKKFELLNPRFELVNATIGSDSPYFYFVEERINNDFFKSRKLPMVIFNKKNYGSLIYNNTFSISELSNKLSNMLRKKSELSKSLKLKIKNDFLKLNTAIQEKNVEVIKQKVDLDYMARLSAFATIYGINGHGFSNYNLEMAYDTINNSFYPILHRDVCSEPLKNSNPPYYGFLDQPERSAHFWSVLSTDTSFQHLTKIKTELFLASNSTASLKSKIDSIHNFYKNSHVFEFSYLNNTNNGSSILENVERLNFRGTDTCF